MTTVVGTLGGLGAAGWTTLSSPFQIIYVSTSAPSGGNGTIGNPYNAIVTANDIAFQHCIQFGPTSYWILLKQGDTIDDYLHHTSINQGKPNGVNADLPFLYGCYHPSFPDVVNPATGVPRPLIRTPSADQDGFSSAGGNFIAVVGLDVYNWHADPNGGSFNAPGGLGSGINIGSPSWSLVEDCRVRFFGNGVNFNGGDNGIDTAIIRRSTINNNYGSGVDGAARNFILHENTSVRNGWSNANHQTGTPSVFYHNFYLTTIGPRSGLIAISGAAPVNYRGNISAQGSNADQMRAGGALVDNAWIEMAGACHTIGAVDVRANLVDRNIYLHQKNSNAIAPGGHYRANFYNLGTCAITNSIFANAEPSGNFSAISDMETGDEYTFDSNVISNWGWSLDLGLLFMNFYRSGIKAVSIENGGQNYTPLSKSISAIGREAGRNNCVLTVNNITGINAWSNGGSAIYIAGIVGDFSGLNGHTYLGSAVDGSSNQIILDGTSAISGNTLSGGTPALYYPYYGTSVNGGTSSAGADIIVGPAGSVVSTYLAGSSGPLGDDYYDNVGAGFSVNQICTTGLAGGTGCTLRVTAVLTNTMGVNNINDWTNSNPGQFPNQAGATGAAYYASIGWPLGKAHTLDGFIDACIDNYKGNWNSNLTAINGLDPYIRNCFGVGGSGPPVQQYHRVTLTMTAA